jgi:putative ATP-binding cassette transporter
VFWVLIISFIGAAVLSGLPLPLNFAGAATDVATGKNGDAVEKYILQLVISVAQHILTVTGIFAGFLLALMIRKTSTFLSSARYYNRKVLYAVSLDSKLTDIPSRLGSEHVMATDLMGAWVTGTPWALQANRIGFICAASSFLTLMVFNLTKSVFPPLALTGWVLLQISCQIGINSLTASSKLASMAASGRYRSQAASMNEFAESIVFYGGTGREAEVLDQRLEDYISLRYKYTWVYISCVLVTFSFLVTGYGVGFMIIAIQMFYIENFPTATFLAIFGSLAQLLAAAALIPVFVLGFAPLSAALGSINELQVRINSLQDYADIVAERTLPGEEIHLNKITALTPNVDKSRPRKLLVKDLDLRIGSGDSLCIMGPSGCGKSSLLRVLGGLWAVDEGTITRPVEVGSNGIFFVPQQSYTPEGNLRDQVIYPHVESLVPDAELVDILNFVELGYLAEKHTMDVVMPWGDMLSGGEQQRLGFARLFYHKPAYAIMDEATSALDVALEHKCLHHCNELGITMISVVHRPSAMQHHRKVLRLDGTGSFQVEQI